MSAAEDMALVVKLACLTDDRTEQEQNALLRVARDVDRKINRQTNDNVHLKDRPTGRCTFSTDHGKRCACRGGAGLWGAGTAERVVAVREVCVGDVPPGPARQNAVNRG